MTSLKSIMKSAEFTAIVILYGGTGLVNLMNGIGEQIEADQLMRKEDKTAEEKKKAVKKQAAAIVSLGIGVACTSVSAGMAGTVGMALLKQIGKK